MIRKAPALKSLNGTSWEMGEVPLKGWDWTGDDRAEVREWLPAAVPGNVRVDLLAAGRIPDPYVGHDLPKSDWVEERDWWYRRRLKAPLLPTQRAFILLHGVDYAGSVFLDDAPLGRHEGMFSRQVYEITGRMQDGGEHELAVRITGSASLPRYSHSMPQRLLRLLAKSAGMYELPYADRLLTLKCPMSFGWDFAPRLRAMGIWDDVELKVSGPAAVLDVWARPTWLEPYCPPARLPLTFFLHVDSQTEMPANIAITLAGENFPAEPQEFRFDVHLRRGRHIYALEGVLEEPQLWWPWERGFPSLYRLRVRILSADGREVLDQAHHATGFRHVARRRHESARDGEPPWQWVVNGQPLFLRGVNWVPADALPGRLREEDYARLLRPAREAGVNFVRVWGGGLREKRAFYEWCDRAGVLIWQEFPIACVFLGRLPADKAYLDVVKGEAGDIVRSLRRHPSLMTWCGGNEVNPRRNRHVIGLLQDIVAAEDGTRPFVPTSPSPGDLHLWDIWHGKAPARVIGRTSARFVSEFGLQAVPDKDSLRKFIPEEELWPPGPAWEEHHAQWEKLRLYASIYPWEDLDGFISASQRAQARLLQAVIEHFRRRRSDCGGLAIWQWNEPWPAVSWSLVDYFGRPKAAARWFGQWYRPLLVSLDMPLSPTAGTDIEADLWLVNDWRKGFAGAHVRVFQGERTFWRGEIDIRPMECRRLARVRLHPLRPDALVEVEIVQGPRRIAHNTYDPAFHDLAQDMSVVKRLRRRAAERFLR